jgi:uncharacterized protein (DUF924 family)
VETNANAKPTYNDYRQIEMDNNPRNSFRPSRRRYAEDVRSENQCPDVVEKRHE